MIVTAIKLMLSSYIWRLTGLKAAGRVLVSEAHNPADEDTALIAALLLVQSGDRAVPLLEASGHGERITHDVLASIDTERSRALLARLENNA